MRHNPGYRLKDVVTLGNLEQVTEKMHIILSTGRKNILLCDAQIVVDLQNMGHDVEAKQTEFCIETYKQRQVAG